MDFWWNTRTIEVQSRIRRLIDGADGTDGVKQASWRQKRGGILMEPNSSGSGCTDKRWFKRP